MMFSGTISLQGKKSSARRNQGIDLLRIVSMLFVVTLHVLGHGGVLANATGTRYAVAYAMEAICYCAVDSFVIISGFCMSKLTFKSRRLISLWFEAAFYSLAIAIFMSIKESNGLSIAAIIKSLTPVSSRVWWFFTQYYALSLFMPFINQSLTQLDSKRSIALLILIFCTLSLLPYLSGVDLFKTSDGYSFLWFIALYSIGGCLYNLDVTRSKKCIAPAVVYVISVVATWLPLMIVHFFLDNPDTLRDWSSRLYSYTSPTVLVAAVSLFLAFANLNITSLKLSNSISIISPHVFSVYLLSDHPLIRTTFISDRFAYLAFLHCIYMCIYLCLIIISIFLICIIIDSIRTILCRFIGIDTFISNLSLSIDNKVSSTSQ